MTTAFDRLLAKVPGSVQFKAFAAGTAVCLALGYPIFFRGKAQPQGHDYFSQERPEAILKGEEASRKQYLKEREERREQRKLQQQHEQQ